MLDWNQSFVSSLGRHAPTPPRKRHQPGLSAFSRFRKPATDMSEDKEIRINRAKQIRQRLFRPSTLSHHTRVAALRLNLGKTGRPEDAQTLWVYSNNLSWATQLNVEAGSEAAFVRHCKRLKRDCTRTALAEIPTLLAGERRSFDLLCFQEIANPVKGREIAQTIQAQQPDFYDFAISSEKFNGRNDITLLTLYPATYGKPSVRYLDLSDGKGRPCQILFFASGLVVINCHWPHFDGASAMEEKVNPILRGWTRSPIDRIIIGGDFNTINPTFQLLQWKFQSATHPITCCCKSDTSRPGDYIFDSQGPPLFFNTPPQYQTQKRVWGECEENPKSDHYAVIALLEPRA